MNRMYLFFLLPAVIMLPFSFYFYHFFKRSLAFWGLNTTKLYGKLISAAAAAVATLPAISVFSVGAVYSLHILAFALIMELINLIVRRKFPSGKWKNVYSCGLIPFMLTFIVVLLGHITMLNIVQTDYDIATPKNIRTEGYRVALIADLHFENTMDEEKLLEQCRLISEQNPDIVVLCGDIVDESTSREGVYAAFKALGTISNKYGIYYIMGNHDLYTNLRGSYNTDDILDALSHTDIILLDNETVQINDDFCIVGRTDEGYSRGTPRITTSELLKEADPERFVLLLDHRPIELEVNAAAGADLQLSGHTHGGQIFPIGLVSTILGEHNYGYKKIEDFQAITTSGIAGWGYPIRTGSRSEYVIVDINQIQN